MCSSNIKRIAVIGAGPAGMIFAMKYKQLSPETQIDVYEKEVFPRHRIGESLLSGVLPPLIDLGLKEVIDKEGFLIKKGAAYKWGSSAGWWDVKFAKNEEEESDSYAWHVRRSEFDQVLFREAKKRGIDFYFNKKVSINIESGSVSSIEVDGKKEEYDYYVDSSGLSKAILKKLDNPKLITEDKRVAIYGYLKGLKTIENEIKREGISIVSFDKGWCWHIPVSDEITSIGIVTTAAIASEFSGKERFISKLKELEDYRSIITDERVYDEYGEEELNVLYSVKNWSYTNGKTFGKNWISIGDSAYFHDPILSQGVTLAIWSGYEAAKYLSNDDIVTFYSIYKEIYLNLKKMTDYWYANNNVEGWFAQSEEILDGVDIKNNVFQKEAFKYITFGEVITDFFDTSDQAAGFDDVQRKKIYDNIAPKD